MNGVISCLRKYMQISGWIEDISKFSSTQQPRATLRSARQTGERAESHQ